MMKFQNSEGFHHSFPLSPCFFQTFHHAFSKPCRIFLNPAIPSLCHHAFAAHFTMIHPTLPFFTNSPVENPPYDPLWQPFLVCFSTSISNHPRLRLYQRATKFSPHNPVIYETKWQSPTSSTRGETSGVK